MSRVCAACDEDKDRDEFSRNQWANKGSSARCIDCVACDYWGGDDSDGGYSSGDADDYYSSDSCGDEGCSSEDEDDVVPFNDAFEDIAGVVRNQHEVDEMVARIEQLCSPGTDRFWIGKTSSGRMGMRARWNTKYRDLGMRHAAIVYQTSSQRLALELETTLIDYFWSQCENPERGGAGRDGRSGPFVVYLMWD